MKKQMKFLFLTILAVLLVAGCAASKDGEGTTKKSDKDTILVWSQAAADHPEGKMFAERIKQYNEENPDKPQVKIEHITRAGAGSGYIDKLNAAITSNNLPDIFALDGPDIAAYVEAGVIGELDSHLSDGFKEGFTDSIIQQGTVDGKFYGMGYSESAVMVTYNKDMINALPKEIQALVPSNDEDWSWEQFIGLAQEIDEFAKQTDDEAFKDYETAVSLLLTDVTSGVYETGTYFFAPILWSNGADLVDEDGLHVDGFLNSDASVESFTKYAQLFAEPALGSTSESEKAFHTGKTALSITGFWYIDELKGNYPNLNYGSLRYPKMNPDFDDLYTPSGSWAFVRSGKIEDEERLEQVVEIMEWLTDDAASESYYKAIGSIPARTAKMEVIDTNTDDENFNEAWTVLKYHAENTNKARPVSVGYPYLSETFAKDVLLKIGQNKVTDEETIRTYVDEAVKKIDREFEKYKK